MLHHATVLALLLSPAPAAPASATPATDLTREMLDAYRSVDSYRATWILTNDEPGDAADRSKVEIAYDRKSGRLLVRRQTLRRDGDAWTAIGAGEIVVSDGVTVRTASRADEFRPWHEDAFVPGEEITYWIVERLLSFELIDLPLLLGEHPLAGWLHGAAGAIDAVGHAGEGHGVGLRLTGAGDEASVSAWIDQSSGLVRAATSENSGRRHTLESISVDERLDPALFDMLAQIDELDPKVFY